MIEYVSGNFFDYEADIRVNTVNCVGVMGAGVALEFKKRYPEMFKEYVKVCKSRKIAPGVPHIWEDRNLFSSNIIINLPTKIDWRNPSEYEYIEKDLIWLQNYLESFGKDKVVVTLPALGCGHGGLDWNIVKDMIVYYLEKVNAKILVFSPDSSNKRIESEIYFHRDANADSHVLFPTNILYPEKLRKVYGKEIYCKGNIELLRRPKVSLILGNKSGVKEKNAVLQILKELSDKEYVYILAVNNKSQRDFANILLENGYKLIFVIPSGIKKFKEEYEYRKYYTSLSIVSFQKPDQDAKRYDYINSLKFRLKLADCILYCDENLDDIEKGYKYICKYENVFYVNFWEESIKEFELMGARKIGISSKTQKPNVMELIKRLSTEK